MTKRERFSVGEFKSDAYLKNMKIQLPGRQQHHVHKRVRYKGEAFVFLKKRMATLPNDVLERVLIMAGPRATMVCWA